jgi:2-oxoglutarate dehydrogenase E2 component (dihydrolipoamide succinyltransferase)
VPVEAAPTPEPEPAIPAAPQPEATQEAPSLSPAVRRLVDKHNLDPATLKGSGKDGRILKADVLAALENPPAPVAQAPAPPVPAFAAPQGPRPEAAREKRVRMTRLRQRIAERLTAAQAQTALLTTFNEVDMTNVMETRRLFRARFEAKHGVKLGFMSFFVKASIEALKDFPAINAEIRGDDIVYRNYFDIGIAIGGGKGLVVPIVRSAERLGFAEIELAIKDFASRAQENKLVIEDLSGGTFTITNGGVYGSLLSTPILNPPQSGVLGLHAIQDRPVAHNGEVVIRPMMYIALTYDHRIVDGREAVTFLRRIKELVEQPSRFLLET